MHDPLLIVVTIIVSILAVAFIAFLISLTILLIALKKTLVKLQAAIDNVEDTALRSLAPLLTFKAMFSDLDGFVGAIKSISRAILKQRRSR